MRVWSAPRLPRFDAGRCALGLGMRMYARALSGRLGSLPHESLPHEVLGIPTCATEDEIQAAFRRRAKQEHPDAGGTDAGMRKVVDARESMLSRLGSNEDSSCQQKPPPQQRSPPQQKPSSQTASRNDNESKQAKQHEEQAEREAKRAQQEADRGVQQRQRQQERRRRAENRRKAAAYMEQQQEQQRKEREARREQVQSKPRAQASERPRAKQDRALEHHRFSQRQDYELRWARALVDSLQPPNAGASASEDLADGLQRFALEATNLVNTLDQRAATLNGELNGVQDKHSRSMLAAMVRNVEVQRQKLITMMEKEEGAYSRLLDVMSSRPSRMTVQALGFAYQLYHRRVPLFPFGRYHDMTVDKHRGALAKLQEALRSAIKR